jgi:hypothetical protein
MQNLCIDNIQVQCDELGRFCINDLHRAAGGENKTRPKYWLENKQTSDLIEEIINEKGEIPPIVAKQGLGTFVIEDLVYAYAAWISPAFNRKVFRVFKETVKPKTTGEMLMQMAASYLEHEQRIMALEASQQETKQAIAELVGGDDYSTVKGYARTHGLSGDRSFLNKVGRRAAAMCKTRGVHVGKVADENWGEVNSYPRDILSAAFDESA